MNYKQHASFYGNGKLLLTGEYLVLDGATALALPCRLGQGMEVTPHPKGGLIWNSYDEHAQKWFHACIDPTFHIQQTNDSATASRLVKILQAVVSLAPDFTHVLFTSEVRTHLSFHKEWGLGTSSTLIYMLSEWAHVNPYTLLGRTFGGSGYDIACASATGPILFQKGGESPHIVPVNFNPSFAQHIYFVYSGKKQISRNEIKKYDSLKFNREKAVERISKLTHEMVRATDVATFCQLVDKHEQEISQILNVRPLQTHYPEINGTFKWLGGWGGDIFMFVGAASELPKFENHNITAILSWNDLILSRTDSIV